MSAIHYEESVSNGKILLSLWSFVRDFVEDQLKLLQRELYLDTWNLI